MKQVLLLLLKVSGQQAGSHVRQACTGAGLAHAWLLQLTSPASSLQSVAQLDQQRDVICTGLSNHWQPSTSYAPAVIWRVLLPL